MSSYQIINDIPGGLNFRKQTNAQLKNFEKWFFQNKEHRLDELQKEYDRVCGGKLDFSVESLKDLSRFMKLAIKKRQLTAEEYAYVKSTVWEWIEVDDYDLTVKSQSLCVDIGIYLGEVFLRQHPKLSWSQDRSKTGFRGYMVIKVNDSLSPFFNPIWVTFTLGHRILRGAFEENELSGMYNLFKEKISDNYK